MESNPYLQNCKTILVEAGIEELSEETLEKIRENAVLEFKRESARNAIKEKYRCKACKILPRQGNDSLKKCKRCDRIFCDNCKRHRCFPTNRRDGIANLPVAFEMEFEIKEPFLPLFCMNNKFGCEKMLFDDAELLKHEKYCEFYKIHCADIDCKTEVCLKNYRDHVKENHKDWKNLGECETFKQPLPIQYIKRMALIVSLKNDILTKFGSYQGIYQFSVFDGTPTWSSDSKAIWLVLKDESSIYWRIGEKSIIGSGKSTFKGLVSLSGTWVWSSLMPTDDKIEWECFEDDYWKKIDKSDISIDIQIQGM